MNQIYWWNAGNRDCVDLKRQQCPNEIYSVLSDVNLPPAWVSAPYPTFYLHSEIVQIMSIAGGVKQQIDTVARKHAIMEILLEFGDLWKKAKSKQSI